MTVSRSAATTRDPFTRPLGWAVLLLAAWLSAGSSLATPQQAESAEAVFNQASTAFQQALQLHDASPGSGQARFLEAAELYRSLIDDHGLDSHALHANRGAALLLAGDTGRAVAAFRRAYRLDPTDAAAAQGLAAARAAVATAPPPAPADRVREVLLSWRGHVPRPSLLVAAVVAYAVAWLAAGARVLGIRKATPVIAAGAVICILAIAPLAIEQALDGGPDHAVVISEVVGLNGPSTSAYTPTFDAPIPPGSECRVLERRDGWARIQLAGDTQTWVPVEAIERI